MFPLWRGLLPNRADPSPPIPPPLDAVTGVASLSGDANARKTLLSSQFVWAAAHRQKYRVWSCGSAFVK